MFEYVIIYTALLKTEQRDHRMDGGGCCIHVQGWKWSR